MINDLLDLVFLFSVDDVWGWSGVVRSMRSRLVIGHEEGRMEDVVDAP
jgi:hypothetical protein